MKRFLVAHLFLGAALAAVTGSGQEFPYHVERVITDYRGAVGNERVILCYGNYGIVTASYDRGASWQQSCIGDRYDIYRIQRWGNLFLGVHRRGIMWSSDDGRSWRIRELSAELDVLDGYGRDSVMYLLLRDRVLRWDASRDAVEQFLALDTTYQWNRIACDSRYVYVMADPIGDGDRFFQVPHSGGEPTFIEWFERYSPYQMYLTVQRDTLYALSFYADPARDFDYSRAYTNASLYVLDDATRRRRRIAALASAGLGYWVEDGYVRYLEFTRQGGFRLQLIVQKLDSTVDFQPFTRTPIDDRLLVYTERKRLAINSIVRVDDSTLVAVGNAKMILISHDNGSSWKWCSFFYGTWDGGIVPYANTNSFTLFQSGSSLLRSTDGMATFLPPYRWTFQQIGWTMMWYFGHDGRGFVQYEPQIGNDPPRDSALAVTTDGGENFQWQNNLPSATSKFLSALHPPMWLYPRIVGDTLMWIGYMRDTTRKWQTIVHRYSKDFERLDTAVIAEGQPVVAPMIGSHEVGVLMCCDTLVPMLGDTALVYTLLSTSDAGTTWHPKSTLQIPKNLRLNSTAAADADALYVTTSTSANVLIFAYLYRENRWDTIVAPRPQGISSYSLASFDGKLWLCGYLDTTMTIYTYDMVRRDGWHSVSLLSYLQGLNVWSPWIDLIDTDAMLYFLHTTDSALYLAIGKRARNLQGERGDWTVFEANLVRIGRQTSVASAGQLHVSSTAQEAILYPQPTTGTTWIECRSLRPDEIATVTIFDVHGRRYRVPWDAMDNGTATRIRLDCTALETGAYLVAILHARGSQVMRLAVVR
ncbi:MAG: T9SS type A sorting domain-containing protein [Chlorobi bacterium]|nr:T9SS type A sorting domain-containing protein [Chlorobiota bacterium]